MSCKDLVTTCSKNFTIPRNIISKFSCFDNLNDTFSEFYPSTRTRTEYVNYRKENGKTVCDTEEVTYSSYGTVLIKRKVIL